MAHCCLRLLTPFNVQARPSRSSVLVASRLRWWCPAKTTNSLLLPRYAHPLEGARLSWCWLQRDFVRIDDLQETDLSAALSSKLSEGDSKALAAAGATSLVWPACSVLPSSFSLSLLGSVGAVHDYVDSNGSTSPTVRAALRLPLHLNDADAQLSSAHLEAAERLFTADAPGASGIQLAHWLLLIHRVCAVLAVEAALCLHPSTAAHFAKVGSIYRVRASLWCFAAVVGLVCCRSCRQAREGCPWCAPLCCLPPSQRTRRFA